MRTFYGSMKRCRVATIGLLVAFMTSSTDAFAPSPLFLRQTTRTDAPVTLLNLHPDQGSQLQAAWNAAVAKAKQHQDEASNSGCNPVLTKPSTTISASTAARAFVSRVFSMPSALIGRHPHPGMEGFDDHFPTTSHEKGVVLYPVVGFQYVPDSENHSRVLPKEAAPHCRIHDMRNEELVGWWSAGCYLDMFDEDIAHPPKASLHP